MVMRVKKILSEKSRVLQKFKIWIFVFSFVLAGGYVLYRSYALTPVASIEPELGTTSGAIVGSDVSASRGSYIQFKSSQPQGNITNGSQINTSNTGYLAWVGPQGQTCTDSNLTVYTSRVNASSLGASATCVWFKGGITIDAAITLTACKVDAAVVSGAKPVTVNFCTINPTSPDDWSLGYTNFTAYRSQITGSSDGVRFGGSGKDTLIENYIRSKVQTPEDHNDGVQMYGATGGATILRNNIDGNPVGGGGSANSAIFIADGASGEYEIRDNYFMGAGYSLRLHDNGYYRVTGNIFLKDSYKYGPVSTTNSRTGAFLEWSNNKLTDGTIVNQ